jgi:hypothetical protein
MSAPFIVIDPPKTSQTQPVLACHDICTIINEVSVPYSRDVYCCNDPVLWRSCTGRSDATNDLLVHFGVRSLGPTRLQRKGFADMIVRRVSPQCVEYCLIKLGHIPERFIRVHSGTLFQFTDTSS